MLKEIQVKGFHSGEHEEISVPQMRARDSGVGVYFEETYSYHWYEKKYLFITYSGNPTDIPHKLSQIWWRWIIT